MYIEINYKLLNKELLVSTSSMKVYRPATRLQGNLLQYEHTALISARILH